jgi:hypothetical protein
LYYKDTNTLVDTFVFTSVEFKTQLENLIQGNPVDLSRITWPRRADGSMDYPPPLDMSRYSASHKTNDRLRLRDNPNSSSLIVTTLDSGVEVQVTETGASATIDGITAPWVKVISSTGYTGWCFSGYLEEIKWSDKTDIGNNAESREISLATNNTNKSPLPLWAWFAIGAIVVVGSAAVFVIKRKK